MATVLTSIKYTDSPSDSDVKSDGASIPPLGEPYQESKRFFWQKSSDNNLDAIATQVRHHPSLFAALRLPSPSQVFLMTLSSPRSTNRGVTGKCARRLSTFSSSTHASCKGEHPSLQPTGTMELARGKGRGEEGRLEDYDLGVHHVHWSRDRPREYPAGSLG